jgi:hypothetical protein
MGTLWWCKHCETEGEHNPVQVYIELGGDHNNQYLIIKGLHFHMEGEIIKLPDIPLQILGLEFLDSLIDRFRRKV